MDTLNGTVQDAPRTQAEAARVLTGEPLTLGYRPRLPVTSFWNRGGQHVTNILPDIEAMLLHPKVALPLAYYRAGIASAKFKIKASSSQVGEFVQKQISRFWERSLSQAQNSYDYGWIGGEPSYCDEQGLLQYDSLIDFFPLDVWVRTEKQQYRGISVQNVEGAQGKVHLWGPGRWPSKAFWFAHNRRFHRWYGRTQLLGAWRPWRRLAYPDGGEEVIDGGFYRFAYRGPTMRYPVKAFRRNDGTTDFDAAREKARQWTEQAKAGISTALPGTRDDRGEYEWQYEWPDHVLDVGPLIGYSDYLEKQISCGIGVPPELLEASETGSGYSGRKVPLIGFYAGQLKNARAIVWAWSVQLGKPMVAWNYGPEAWFEIEVELTIPEIMNGEEGPGQGGPPPGRPPGQGEQPGQALPFDNLLGGLDKGGKEMALADAEPTSWGDLVANVAPHVRIIGNTGSGKSTIAQAIAAKAKGMLFVIDPVWEPGHWGDLPAVTVSKQGECGPIDTAIQGLLDEMRSRGGKLQEGTHDFEPLTIVFDEVPDTVSELPDSAGLLIRRLAQRGRHGAMRLVGIGQSSRVNAWGIAGYGDTAENFATIYLGNKAIEQIPGLAGQERPGALEWQGKLYPIDLSEIMEWAKQPIPRERLFQLPSGPTELPQIDDWLGRELGSLFDETDHPRDDDGTWVKAEHVREAKKQQRAGNLQIHRGEPVQSAASGRTIRHHVVLGGGVKVHPDELARLRTDKGGRVYLDHDEDLTVVDQGGRQKAKSFGRGIGQIVAFAGREPDEPVTLQSAHGYTVTKTRQEWAKLKEDLGEHDLSFSEWFDRGEHKESAKPVSSKPAGRMASEPFRLIGGASRASLFATATGKGRWITIGGRKGEDGNSHGGSPVFVQGGKIVKGHPSLTGRRIDALQEEAEEDGHRKQLSQSRGYARAVFAKKARQEGLNSQHLHQMAAEVLAHDKAFKAERTKILQEARKTSEGLGYGSLTSLKARIAGGRVDSDSVRGLDDVAERMAERYPDVFAGHDPQERLFEMLSEGNPEPMTEEEAYTQAFDYLMEHKQESPEDSGVPFSTEAQREAGTLQEDEQSRPFEFAAEYHGPRAPGPGWVLVGTGSRGGNIWRAGPHAAKVTANPQEAIGALKKVSALPLGPKTKQVAAQAYQKLKASGTSISTAVHHLAGNALMALKANPKDRAAVQKLRACVEMVKMAQQEAVAAKPKETPTHESPAGKIHSDIDAQIQGMAHLSAANKKHYSESVKKVLGRMPEAALKRFAQHAKGFTFHDTSQSLNQYFSARHPAIQKLVAQGGKIGGAYQPSKGQFHLDGNILQETSKHFRSKNEASAHHTYAHEFAHAVDGPKHEISGGLEWQAAFKAEIAGGKLSRYATTEASEGFAEFARLAWASDHGAAKIERHFPRCAAVWKKHGLWPK